MGMMAEKCKLGWLKLQAPFYGAEPLIEPKDVPPGFYVPPRYVGQTDLDPDTWVWVVYEDWLHDNPWLKPGAGQEDGIECGPSTLGVARALEGMDDWLR